MSPRKKEQSDWNSGRVGRLRRLGRCLFLFPAIPLWFGGSKERIELLDFGPGHRFPDVQAGCKVPPLPVPSLIVLVAEDRGEILFLEVEWICAFGIKLHEALVRVLKEGLEIPEK